MLVERVVLALHRAAATLGWPPGVALGDEPAGTGGLRRREQDVRALGPQPVGLGEVALEVAQIERLRERGQLMEDHLRPRRADRGTDGVRVERIGDRRLGAELAHEVGALHAAGHARDVVTGRH